MTELLLTRAQVARLLAVIPHTLSRWASQGRFPKPIKLGHRSVRYSPQEIEDGMKQRQQQGGYAPGPVQTQAATHVSQQYELLTGDVLIVAVLVPRPAHCHLPANSASHSA